MTNQGITRIAAAVTLFTALTLQQGQAQMTTGTENSKATSTPLEIKYLPLANSDHPTFNQRIPEIIKAVEKLPDSTTGTIVMVGDSITHGFFRGKHMPEKLHGLPVINQGISGDRIDRPDANSGVTKRVGLIVDARPAAVFVMIGINDYWGGKGTPEEVIPRYEAMFKMIKTALPDTPIVWQSVLPTGKDNAYMNPSVDLLNEKIKSWAEAAGDTYLDLHPVMEDEKGELKEDFSGDGVHLSKEAYDVWLQELNKVLPTVLK